jgi:NADH-quinone oxidoreductase subunit H
VSVWNWFTASLLVSVMLAALLVSAGVLTWAERRLLGLWQERYGPNRAGPFGVFQWVADGLKILMKEDSLPPFVDRPLFIIAPGIIVATMLAAFAVVPVTPDIVIADLNIGLLFFLAMTSLSVYSVVLGGWASNSKYALLGGMRASAQMISYEVFMGLSIMGVVMLAGTFSLKGIVMAQQDLWFCVPQILGLVTFFVASLAESHRLPFDLPEAENELVAGYHTEYSGMKFGMFFVGEYLGILVASAFIVTLFFGGWLGPWLPPLVWFVIKVAIVAAFYVLLRASLPRPRFDQLMAYGWKFMLPVTLLNVAVTGAVALAFT